MITRMTVDARKHFKGYVDMLKFFSFTLTVLLVVFGVVVYLLVSEPLGIPKGQEETYFLQDFTVTVDVPLRKDPGFKIISPIKENYYLDYPSLLNCDWCFYVKQKYVELNEYEDILTFEEA